MVTLTSCVEGLINKRAFLSTCAWIITAGTNRDLFGVILKGLNENKTLTCYHSRVSRVKFGILPATASPAAHSVLQVAGPNCPALINGTQVSWRRKPLQSWPCTSSSRVFEGSNTLTPPAEYITMIYSLLVRSEVSGQQTGKERQDGRSAPMSVGKMWRVAESKVRWRLTFSSCSCYSHTVDFSPCPLTPYASFNPESGSGPSINDLCAI